MPDGRTPQGAPPSGEGGPERSLPVPDRDSRAWTPEVAAAAVQSAMEMQVEVLRKIQEQQEQTLAALQDSRRSEMMIQSTRALNESFAGMRRVQEGLAERLDRERRRGSWTPWLLLGALALAGYGLYAAVGALGGKVEAGARKIIEARDGSSAREALAEISDLRNRFQSLEREERAGLLERLSRLESQVEAVEEARRQVVLERDRAREELGSLKAEWSRALEAKAAKEAEASRLSEELKQSAGRLAEAEASVARITADRVADQALIRELLAVSARDREPLEAAASEVGAAPESPAAAGPEDASATGRIAATPALIGSLNKLLQRHGSSEDYRVTGATMVDGSALYGVTLEVRGRDGSLAKTVHAERMGVVLTSGPRFVELDFEGGFVEYLRGISRTVRSPFFNNRYQIVVLGIAPEEWIAARLPFLKVQ